MGLRFRLATLLSFAFLAPRTFAGVPDITNSFYVPQAGTVSSPQEGSTAYRNFRICPNNDLGTNNARIKVVLRDSNNNGVAGIEAADICILLNGGTAAQGFSGVGTDSIVANSAYNPAASCPDLRCIEADAPTDASGITYITFAGSTPGSPGVATRDPARKWGHFDSELPVYVLGRKIPGRLTTASANGTYTLLIKNLDVIGGLGTEPNRGEAVTKADLNVVVGSIGGGQSCGLSYWLDFSGDGQVTAPDFNLFIAHYGHDCNTPNNP